MTPSDISALPYRPNVGVVLINAEGQIFTAQRIDSDTPAWQMPQGGIDDGEDPCEAALRELEEETGVPRDLVTIKAQTADWITYDLPDELIAKLWKGRFRGQKQLWYLMQFHGADTDINIETDHPEFSAWAWLSSAEMIEKIVPFKRAVYQAVVAEFADHLA